MSLGPISSLGSLELTRAWGLAFLLLPLALWLLSRLRPRPVSRLTGTMKLWRELSQGSENGSLRARSSLRPVLLIVLAALIAGSLGMAGIVAQDQPRGRQWRVIVDQSPSMYLGQQDEGSEGRTRLARAVSLALEMLRRLAGPEDSVEWIGQFGEPLNQGLGEAPPAAWLAQGPVPVAAPAFVFEDHPGSLWLTDAHPEQAPQAAGLIAVGGQAVPGPIGVDKEHYVDWDGVGMQLGTRPLGTRRVSLEFGALGLSRPDNPLADLFLLWARERRFEIEGDNPKQADLLLSFSAARESDEFLLASTGRWSLQGPGGQLQPESNSAWGSERTWLRGSSATEESLALVCTAPGRIRVAWSHVQAPAGSQAAFALAWSELFDQCLRPAKGVIAIAERRAPGEPAQWDPEPALLLQPARHPGQSSTRWSLWLAASAALLALLALIFDHSAS